MWIILIHEVAASHFAQPPLLLNLYIEEQVFIYFHIIFFSIIKIWKDTYR